MNANPGLVDEAILYGERDPDAPKEDPEDEDDSSFIEGDEEGGPPPDMDVSEDENDTQADPMNANPGLVDEAILYGERDPDAPKEDPEDEDDSSLIEGDEEGGPPPDMDVSEDENDTQA